MTQVKRLAFLAYITAACGTSTLLLGTAWWAGCQLRLRPETILWWGTRDVLGFPAKVFLIVGIGWMVVDADVRRNPFSTIAVVLLVLAVYRCTFFRVDRKTRSPAFGNAGLLHYCGVSAESSQFLAMS
ncbi:MAG: hypothetical protein NTZ32_20440 [Planctomycetales bacterium]|nr:hypothetical protein [Planctomycetales bacterium]